MTRHRTPRFRRLRLLLLGLPACSGPPADTGADTARAPDTVPWSSGVPAAADEIPDVAGYRVRRAIAHLHSPWSHDACDGDPLPDGAPNEDCLADLRAGLCATHVDYAFLSDHPSYFAFQPWEGITHPRDGDVLLDAAGEPADPAAAVAMRITCDDGHVVTWLPGVEDELMPLALDGHPGEDAEENDAIYNTYTPEAVGDLAAAGGTVWQAHTESKDREKLGELVDAGLRGVELFNLHAMFAPDIRSEYLGLDAAGWLADIAPFTDAEGTAEPDLLFLAVLIEQEPSIAAWDALQQRVAGERIVAGSGGTDAHENALPIVLRDGERGDSYRRMLRWFANDLLVEDDTPAAAEEALARGRFYVAFDALGTPVGVEVTVEDDSGELHTLGEESPPGTLHVGCPALSPHSPRGEESPEITATIFRDGEVWAEGCGDHAVTDAGFYRVRYDIVPNHLRPFLGEDPDPWIHAYPWVYTNPIHVADGR